jgi:hypothetical protein
MTVKNGNNNAAAALSRVIGLGEFSPFLKITEVAPNFGLLFPL